MIFWGVCHDPFQKYVEEGGWEQTSLSDSNCCSEPVSYAAVEEDCTSGLAIEVFDDLDKVCADVVLVVAHRAACQTLSKAFLKSMKTWKMSCWCWRYFSQRIRRLKICFVVLLPALKPARSSAIIFSACGFNLFSMIFSMTLLGWLMRLIVR